MMKLLASLVLTLCCISADAYTGRGESGILSVLLSANMNTTADQAIVIPAQITKWVPAAIRLTNCSGTPSLAVGGFYSAASKGGITLVANTQTYTTLTSATVLQSATLTAAASTTAMTVLTIYFSLTTAQGSALTCDVYLQGVDLS